MARERNGDEDEDGDGDTPSCVRGAVNWLSTTHRAAWRTLSVAEVGLSALAAAAGVRSHSCGEALLDGLACATDWLPAPADYPTVDTHDGSPTARHVPTDADTLAFFCHGYGAWPAVGRDNAYTFDVAAREQGYDVPTVAVLWDAVEPNWYAARETVEDAAGRFADWLVGYADVNPDTDLVLVGHSMGGRFVTATLNALDGRVVVADAVLLGAAIDNDDVCGDRRWAPGIRESAERVSNFHSGADEIVGPCYAALQGQPAAGNAGAARDRFVDPPPANYTDHDVTATVTAHCAYHRPDHGCVPAVVDTLAD